MKIEFSGQIVQKWSSTNFHENLPVGAKLINADGQMDTNGKGQTDRHGKANIRFLQFCERASK
jgi:hypothetical protein